MSTVTTTTLPPKTTMCDYSFARPLLGGLRGAGIRGVIRYLSYSVNGKNITPKEVQDLHAAGLGILLVWENVKTDPLQGAALGHQHGAEAVRQAKALGYPSGLPIFCAVDFDTKNSAQIAQIVAYVGGFSWETRSNGYQTGWYGGSRLWLPCKDLVDIRCRAAAGAWSPIGLYATAIFNPEIRQGNQAVVGGGSIDWDFTTTNVNVWLPHDTGLPVLKRGSRGPYVTWMQTILAKLNYRIAVDGKFESQTENFVKWFQASHGLPVTGVVDAATWAELAKIG